jgi:NADH-quinone oxidoreductase subunit M
MIQMFNHGVNIIGLWIVVELIERQFGTRKLSELGGLAQKAPAMAILFVIVALANIALPLTNAFVGEFLMFTGIFNSGDITRYNVVFTVAAGICIILAAIYTLNMVRKIFYGNTIGLTQKATDLHLNEKFALGIIVVLIFWMGVFPQLVLDITSNISDSILKVSDVRHLLKKSGSHERINIIGCFRSYHVIQRALVEREICCPGSCHFRDDRFIDRECLGNVSSLFFRGQYSRYDRV